MSQCSTLPRQDSEVKGSRTTSPALHTELRQLLLHFFQAAFFTFIDGII
jgi:hypothetical protein